MYCITSSSWGGAQLHVLELCEYEKKMGNDIVFVVGNDGPLTEKVRKIDGVKVIVLSTLHREISLKNDVRVIFDLRHILKKEQPDIIHLHSSKAGIVGRIAAISLKTKSVFTVHGWAFTDGISSKSKKFIYRLIEKMVAPFTNLFICVSQFDYDIGMRDRVLSKKKKNAIVVHNGVPENKDKNFLKNKISVHSPMKIVMTARFSSQKDQESLILALAEIKGFEYSMLFVGDGETLIKNKDLVRKLNLTNKVKFIGFKENVIKYLKESDIYVLSTHYEGLPISIIEAMSCGLPIIASDVGGNKELIEHNGYLTENIEDIKNALVKMLSNPKKTINLGKNSYDLFKRKFTLDSTLKKIDYQYQLLLNKEI